MTWQNECPVRPRRDNRTGQDYELLPLTYATQPQPGNTGRLWRKSTRRESPRTITYSLMHNRCQTGTRFETIGMTILACRLPPSMDVLLCRYCVLYFVDCHEKDSAYGVHTAKYTTTSCLGSVQNTEDLVAKEHLCVS